MSLDDETENDLLRRVITDVMETWGGEEYSSGKSVSIWIDFSVDADEFRLRMRRNRPTGDEPWDLLREVTMSDRHRFTP